MQSTMSNQPLTMLIGLIKTDYTHGRLIVDHGNDINHLKPTSMITSEKNFQTLREALTILIDINYGKADIKVRKAAEKAWEALTDAIVEIDKANNTKEVRLSDHVKEDHGAMKEIDTDSLFRALRP